MPTYTFTKDRIWEKKLRREILDRRCPDVKSVTFVKGLSPDNLTIEFEGALSEGEQATLANIVRKHRLDLPHSDLHRSGGDDQLGRIVVSASGGAAMNADGRFIPVVRVGGSP